MCSTDLRKQNGQEAGRRGALRLFLAGLVLAVTLAEGNEGAAIPGRSPAWPLQAQNIKEVFRARTTPPRPERRRHPPGVQSHPWLGAWPADGRLLSRYAPLPSRRPPVAHCGRRAMRAHFPRATLGPLGLAPPAAGRARVAARRDGPRQLVVSEAASSTGGSDLPGAPAGMWVGGLVAPPGSALPPPRAPSSRPHPAPPCRRKERAGAATEGHDQPRAVAAAGRPLPVAGRAAGGRHAGRAADGVWRRGGRQQRLRGQ